MTGLNSFGDLGLKHDSRIIVAFLEICGPVMNSQG